MPQRLRSSSAFSRDYGIRNLSPKTIAAVLNRERAPGPSGGAWSQTTINGNRRTIKREVLETTVLDALRTRLLVPAVYAAFVRGFTAEWNKEQGARNADQAGKRDEVGRLTRKIGNLVEAVAESGFSAALQAALATAEARKAMLEAELAAADAPAPLLLRCCCWTGAPCGGISWLCGCWVRRP